MRTARSANRDLRRWLLPLVLTLPGSALAVDDACDAFGPLTTPTVLADADTRVESTTSHASLGRAVATGDLDGDGIDDLAIGAPGASLNGAGAGAVYIFYGPIEDAGSLADTDADAVLTGPHADAHVGWSLAIAGDLDADGRQDLLVGSNPGEASPLITGGAWVLYGSNRTGTLALTAEAGAFLFGRNIGDGFGQSVAGAGDVDGDGLPDILIGAPNVGNHSGAAYVFSGPMLGTHGAVAADVILPALTSGGRAGTAVAGPGDLTGDGIDDLVIGAPRDGTTGSKAGAVYIVAGQPGLSGTVSLDSATSILRGEAYDRFGSSLAAAGDTDGDGQADLWIGARQWGALKKGAAHLLSGGAAFGDTSGAEVATATLKGAVANGLLGSALAGGVDFDGDGWLDVVIGAERARLSGNATPGAAWVVHGPFAGASVVSTTEGTHSGDSHLSFAGSAVAAGDLNDDGFADAIVGAWRADVGGIDSAGRVAVVLGGHDLVDELPWYADTDADGWGDDATLTVACVAPPGFVPDGGDCDDTDAAFHPFALELDCGDPRDLSCDGIVGMVDADGDGLTACMGDCDETRANVNLIHPELCGDGLDNDCSGIADDDGAVDALMWYPDSDGDGFGIDLFGMPSCTQPTGFLSSVVHVGGDCDDLDVAVNPAAAEVCNTIDDDCDGQVDGASALDATPFYADADADGFGATWDVVLACAQPAGTVADRTDCDDSSADVFPGAVEICDYVDNDCDGAAYLGGPVQVDNPHTTLTGELPGDKLGGAIAIVPDMSGDGLPELLVGAAGASDHAANAGAVYLIDSDAAGGVRDLSLTLPDGSHRWRARIRTDRARSRAGAAVAAGDFNGDGIGDLAIGAWGMARPSASQGAVFIFHGPVQGDLDLEDADVIWSGVSGDDRAGSSLAAGDLDGDGLDDLLIGAPRAESGGTRRGAVYLHYGATDWSSGRLDAVADATLGGSSDRDELGASVSFAGDLDGDGFGDLAAGAPASGVVDTGLVLLVRGQATRLTGTLTASTEWTMNRASQGIGLSLAAPGDVDGDGFDDLLIGSALNDAWVLYGAASLIGGNVNVIRSTLIEGSAGEALAARVAAAGDVNADGLGDLLLSAHDSDEGTQDGGGAYLIYGAPDLGPLVTTASVESFGRLPEGETFPTFSVANLGGVEGARLLGTVPGARLGTGLAGGFDLDGDGHPDVVLGAIDTQEQRGHVLTVRSGPYGTDIESKGAWRYPLELDGDVSEWVPAIVFPTANPAATAAITWDADFVYIGLSDLTVATGGPDHHLTLAMGDGTTGVPLGVDQSGQLPALSFDATRTLTWSPAGPDVLYRHDGASWVPTPSWLGTDGSSVAVDGERIELRIPRGELGSPRLQLAMWWTFTGAGSATSTPLTPADAFVGPLFDPDIASHHTFFLDDPVAPRPQSMLEGLATSPILEGLATSPILETRTEYIWDRDVDGQGTDTLETFLACPMHAPISFVDPLNPRLMGITDPNDATDCDDSDPTIYLGAPELDDDGIDRDCDGYDNINKLPVLDLVLEPVFTDEVATVLATITDPDAGTPGETPITLSWQWYVDGVLAPAFGPTCDGNTHFDRGQLVEVQVVADDGRDLTPPYSASFIVPNRPPTLDSVTLDPLPATDADTITAVAAGLADADPSDGALLSTSCVWERLSGADWLPLDSGPTLEACLTSGDCVAGDTVRAVCTPFDGTDSGPPVASSPAEIIRSNTPPEATSCSIEEYADEDLLANAAGFDSDGDEISWKYTWTLVHTGGITETVPGTSLLSYRFFGTQDTTVTVTCTPSDADGPGVALTSAPYVHSLDGDGPEGDGACDYSLTITASAGASEVGLELREAVEGYLISARPPGTFATTTDTTVSFEVPWGPIRFELYDEGNDGLGGVMYELRDAGTGTLYASGFLDDGARRSEMVSCGGTASLDTADPDFADCVVP